MTAGKVNLNVLLALWSCLTQEGMVVSVTCSSTGVRGLRLGYRVSTKTWPGTQTGGAAISYRSTLEIIKVAQCF